MRAHGLLLICVIGVIALQSAQAEVKQIQCYKCNSEEGDDCTTLDTQKLDQCTNAITTPSPSTTGSTSSSSAPTGSAASSPASTESTASSPASTESTASSPVSTESTASSPASTKSTAASPASTKSTAASPASTKSTAASPASTESTAASPASTKSTAASPASMKLTSDDSVEVKRKRRNVIGRFSRVSPFADQEPGVWCYRVEAGTENKSLDLGCTQDANFCKDKGDGCRICDTDECNSATANIAFASLVVSLVAALWLTK